MSDVKVIHILVADVIRIILKPDVKINRHFKVWRQQRGTHIPKAQPPGDLAENPPPHGTATLPVPPRAAGSPFREPGAGGSQTPTTAPPVTATGLLKTSPGHLPSGASL